MEKDNSRKIFIEKHYIRFKRVNYFRKIKEYKEEGRTIVFSDEPYIHFTHVKSYCWSDGSIITTAGRLGGKMTNSRLIFKSGEKSDDYHNDMDAHNYEKWLTTQLIPNLSILCS